MEQHRRRTTNGNAEIDKSNSTALVARAYQMEMYEASRKRNVIVTMDTGTGKTAVAALRIMAELQDTGPEKRVWFMVPKVALCQQQCAALQTQIRSVQIRSFSSLDNVDKWKSKKLWDDALTNVRVAVATYAVLQNALDDAFVTMESIALIVFDEAHNCVGKSHARKIMNHYWFHKRENRPVPHIMGLTASPTNGTSDIDLAELEATLDAVCVGPRNCRENLLFHANRPTVKSEYYKLKPTVSCSTSILSLQAAFRSLDIQEDPDVLRWKSEDTEQSRSKLKRALEEGKTFARDQLKTFCRRSQAMCEQLGVFAADHYVAKVATMFSGSLAANNSSFSTWDYSSRVYLARALRLVAADPGVHNKVLQPGLISAKMQRLIDILSSYNDSTRGIVFVTERSSAIVVCHLLSLHPAINKVFRVGAMVGTSEHERGKRDLSDTLNSAEKSEVLEQFRDGRLNLLVATSVLEEGIDVPACNLVISFDESPTVKSYIQRRGRARQPVSDYVILVDEASTGKSTTWPQVEEKLRKQYAEDDRELQRLALVARDEANSREFRVPGTGARLDMDNAKSRLQYFCGRIANSRYANKQPYYICENQESSGSAPDGQPCPWIKAKVVLPVFIGPNLRVTWSKESWLTPKNATKDAAFEAYMRLYEAGLVNEHLKPLNADGPGDERDAGDYSIIDVREQLDPWLSIAQAWRSGESLRGYTVVVKDSHGNTECTGTMTIPIDIHKMAPIPLYQDGAELRRVEIRKSATSVKEASESDHTGMLLTLAYGHRWRNQDKQQLALFTVRGGNAPAREDHEKVTPTANDLKLGDNSAAAAYSNLGKLIPFILHNVEAHLVAQVLHDALCREGGGDISVSLIRSAITTPARKEAQYRKLEFIGDTCLKLLTTVFVTAKYPEWPEGYLTQRRATMISNSRLCEASIARDIDKFVLARVFKAANWRPTYLDDVNDDGPSGSDDGGARPMAGKTLADVVKALVGAGKLDGGYPGALAVAKAMLTEIDLPSLEVGRRQLFDASPGGSAAPLPTTLQPLQTLAGHSFANKALLVEATTHGSTQSSSFAPPYGCYGRLAFLGNAVVESIVAEEIYAREGRLSHSQMNIYRSAVVNGRYLGFVALEWHTAEKGVRLRRGAASDAAGGFARDVFDVDRALWHFMTYSSKEMAAEMRGVEGRFAALRGDIVREMESGTSYPWVLLARLRANDFYADLVESLVGAVWVDSGSMADCRKVLDRMGILPCLRRIMNDQVHAIHPKEELQILAGSEAVSYHVEERRVAGNGQEMTCTVHVGGRKIAEVHGDGGDEELQVMAAERARSLLKLVVKV